MTAQHTQLMYGVNMECVRQKLHDSPMAKKTEDSAPVALRKLRERAGLSMDALAREVGYKHASALQRYENPQEYKHHHFPINLVQKLAKGLIGKGDPPIEEEDVYLQLAGVSVLPHGRYYMHSPIPEVDPHLTKIRNGHHRAGAHFGPAPDIAQRGDLVVYGSAQGGPTGMLVTPQPIEWIVRPPPLLNVNNGFAVYVVGDSMDPAYRQGDMAYVHPAAIPGRGDDVLIYRATDGEWAAMIKQLRGYNDKTWKVYQHNPPQEFELKRADWPKALVIVGRQNRR